jgi:CIC family chloride channel protein
MHASALMRLRSGLMRRLGPPHRSEDWLVWGVLIGAVSGVLAIVFFASLELAGHLVASLTGFHPPSPAGEGLFGPGRAEVPVIRTWLLALMPALGGLVSGLLVYTLAPEAEGHGTDAMIDAFHNKGGRISAVVPAIKGAATIAALASGGSAGREGPIAQMGAGLGSWISQRMGLRVKEVRIMLLAGTAGGLGAIFRAPLGGAMTAIEVLYREDFESEAFIPCVLSSVTAYTLFSTVFGHDTIFLVPRFSFTHLRELPFYALLGLLCLPFGALYCRFFYAARDSFFRKLPVPRHLRPALGGLIVGGIVLFRPEVFGAGLGYLQKAIYGHLAVGLMLQLAVLKVLATTATISSGGSGGVFGPTLLMGGMLGGAIGYGAHAIFPDLVTQPAAYVLVGMAALFAGVAHAPLGALLMITEMSGGYALVSPLMTISAFAILFSKRWSIYRNQVQNKFHSPAHLGNMMTNVLQSLRVRDAWRSEARVAFLRAGTPLVEIRRRFQQDQQLAFPVLDEAGGLLGMVTLSRVRAVFYQAELDTVLIAADLVTDSVSCHLDEDLLEVLSRMMEARCQQIPVLDPQDGTVVGLLHHGDILAAYHRRMIGAADPAAVEAAGR